ncbi:MAG: hypothetical protein VXY99_12615, partial [Pseudomonadota bacterium]|nr:hypothetical protein [Pseudomonadota bacterium]
MTGGGTMTGNINFAATQGFNADQLTSGTVSNDRLSLAQQLQDIVGLSPTDGSFIVGDGTNFVLESGNTARTSLGLGSAATANTTDFATAAQGTTADAAMPKSGGTFTDDVTFTGFLYDAVWDKSTSTLDFETGGQARFGGNSGFNLYHNGTNAIFGNGTGNLIISNNADDKDITLRTDNGSGSTVEYVQAKGSTGEVILKHYGTEKFKTTSAGVQVTGTLNGHTIPSGTGTVALTSDVDTAISNLVDSAPAALDTLNELSAALNNDANFSTTVTNSIADKMPKSGGTFTDDVTFTGFLY